MKRVSIHRTYGHRPPSAASPRGALRRFLLSFLFLIYTSVCAFPLPGWKPVYLPFDSLARLCEQGVEEARSPEYRRRVRSLYAIATEHHHLRVLQWRAMYWDAFGLWRTGHADSAAVFTTICEMAGVPCQKFVNHSDMAGGSTPVNLAGALVVHNCEALAGLVLSQVTRKGAKFIYGSSSTAMDLRYGAAVVGTPELAMLNAGVACMARYYKLPSWAAGG